MVETKAQKGNGFEDQEAENALAECLDRNAFCFSWASMEKRETGRMEATVFLACWPSINAIQEENIRLNVSTIWFDPRVDFSRSLYPNAASCRDPMSTREISK
jgi:hypothetical protein